MRTSIFFEDDRRIGTRRIPDRIHLVFLEQRVTRTEVDVGLLPFRRIQIRQVVDVGHDPQRPSVQLRRAARSPISKLLHEQADALIPIPALKIGAVDDGVRGVLGKLPADRILSIGDNANLQSVLSGVVEEEPFPVDVARDGLRKHRDVVRTMHRANLQRREIGGAPRQVFVINGNASIDSTRCSCTVLGTAGLPPWDKNHLAFDNNLGIRPEVEVDVFRIDPVFASMGKHPFMLLRQRRRCWRNKIIAQRIAE